MGIYNIRQSGKNRDDKYRPCGTYQEDHKRNTNAYHVDLDDYLETLDAYGKKKNKRKQDPSDAIDPDVKRCQRIFGKGYWWWILKQSLYLLFSGPLIWLQCKFSDAGEIISERKKANCAGMVALPFFLFFSIFHLHVFYILGGTPELVLSAIATKNIHLLDGITTEMAFQASNYISYGMRGFKQWLTVLSIIFAFAGKRSFVNGYYKNEYESRKAADRSLPKEKETGKRSINLTKREKKHYAKIDKKLQMDCNDPSVPLDKNDDYLAEISRNLSGMFYDDEKMSKPQKDNSKTRCKWKVVLEEDGRKWITQCGVKRPYYDVEEHVCPYCKHAIRF